MMIIAIIHVIVVIMEMKYQMKINIIVLNVQMGLIRIKKNEVYCKIEENQNKWNCITLGDLVGDKE